MRVLWITNLLMPAAAKQLGIPIPVGGGWMSGLAAELQRNRNLTLGVVSLHSAPKPVRLEIDGTVHYLLPDRKSLTEQTRTFKTILAEFDPQLAHIHGTEKTLGAALLDAKPELPYVVSIQGLISVIHRYYHGGMTCEELLSSITLRDIIRRDWILAAKKRMSKHSLVEQRYLRNARIVVGRTDWDEIHSRHIAPNSTYRFCNESLRQEFYSGNTWQFDACSKGTVFLSQGYYPLKGLHIALKALRILVNSDPFVKLQVAGHNIFEEAGPVSKLKRSGYSKYINNLIRDLDLSGSVVFLGNLDATQMRSAYLNANVYLCASAIENSPNSLGEAQLLGTPVVAAAVGGIPYMTEGGRSAMLYRYEEPEALAHAVSTIINDASRASHLSHTAQQAARQRHDPKVNARRMFDIYSEALSL